MIDEIWVCVRHLVQTRERGHSPRVRHVHIGHRRRKRPGIPPCPLSPPTEPRTEKSTRIRITAHSALFLSSSSYPSSPLLLLFFDFSYYLYLNFYYFYWNHYVSPHHPIRSLSSASPTPVWHVIRRQVHGVRIDDVGAQLYFGWRR